MFSRMRLVYVAMLLAYMGSLVASDFQGDALYALRNMLNASSSQLSDWNQNQVNPCTWTNVYCDSNNNVISVTLSSMGFSGSLTPRIGVLKRLSTLSLQGNGITGEIPVEVGYLLNLQNLDLENNRLSGQIPPSLGGLRKLQFLSLSHNNLSGPIPESFANLPSLIRVQLDSNHLSGQVPAKLFQVPTYNFTGNDLNCGTNFSLRCASSSNNTGSSNKSKLGIIIGVIGGLIGFVLFGGVLFLLCKGRRKGYKREVFVDVAGIQFSFLNRVDLWRPEGIPICILYNNSASVPIVLII
ncbi:hypothetical protein IFM89_008535 [Coptis chinensis]|uniref:Leucine-rich repeat-containing N-terminal plant-type domain-containing protein n=1 Tax=Coptis chinensis TaxID=261450 RepID=A0A835HY22_9MAGN|nr:hypothetical protein IFM89_008535 [Coptis chinensis]